MASELVVPLALSMGQDASVRRVLLIVAAALVVAAVDHFLYHGVRVTESYVRFPLG